jgi:hypothetical protein
MNGKVNGGAYNSMNLSLYAYGANNPVKYVDLDGNEVMISGTNEERTQLKQAFQKLSDDTLIMNNKGNLSISKIKDNGSLKYGTSLVRKLISDKKTVTASINNKGVNRGAVSGGKYTIRIDPERKVIAHTRDSNGEEYGERIPTYIILAHEGIHALDLIQETSENNSFDSNIRTYTYTLDGINKTGSHQGAEMRAVGIKGFIGKDGISENSIRAEHGLNERIHY